KSRCRVVNNLLRMGIEHRFQKQCIGICRLEAPDIERWRKIVNEDSFVDADRTVELIVVEETAPTARYECGLVTERRQRMGKAAVEATCALLEEVVGT